MTAVLSPGAKVTVSGKPCTGLSVSSRIASPAAPDAAVISRLNGRPTGTSTGSRASHRSGGPGGTAAEPAPPGVLVDKGT